MKAIILAGGLPSTLIEEDEKMPKPMAEIGEHPLLWHIMKQYAYYGCNDFIICTGYKGEVIKDYFRNFYIYQSDITVDLQTNEIQIHRKRTEDWKVSIIDTGVNASIMERLVAVKSYIGEEAVLVSYGDCLSDINIQQLEKKHRETHTIATFALAHPTGRNEILKINTEGYYEGIKGKKDAWVNACCMILEPEALKYLNDSFESRLQPTLMDTLAIYEPVGTYRHDGFWAPVETIRDKTWVENLWTSGQAPWKVWAD